MKLEWAMHQRVVHEPTTGREVPTILGMQALVVVNTPITEVPQPHRQGYTNQAHVRKHLSMLENPGHYLVKKQRPSHVFVCWYHRPLFCGEV